MAVEYSEVELTFRLFTRFCRRLLLRLNGSLVYKFLVNKLTAPSVSQVTFLKKVNLVWVPNTELACGVFEPYWLLSNERVSSAI